MSFGLTLQYGLDHAQMVATDHIFLDLKNPRHEPYESQEQVIAYLCRDEMVLALAKDIAKVGLNQLELFALIPTGPTKRGVAPSFVVAEGNRRMCALKLLNDPDLAPVNKRRDFQRLAEDWTPIPKVFAAVFKKQTDVDLWIDRIHGGLQGGIGRKTWNPEQKTRHSGDLKNAVAQSVLDYAETVGLISAAERKGKITTVQRYMDNPLVREAMGIENSNPQDPSRTRPKEDFFLLMSKFITDLLSGDVHSRSNKSDRERYSRELNAVADLSGARIEPQSLNNKAGAGMGEERKGKPEKPENIQHIAFDRDLEAALKAIPSYKLERFYFSICDIGLPDHTPFLSIGLWSFMETLTACTGRNANTDFYSYLSVNKLKAMGLGNNRDTKALRNAIKRVSDYGNSTKHHKKAAALNPDQLANDMEVMGEMLIKLAKETKGKVR